MPRLLEALGGQVVGGDDMDDSKYTYPEQVAGVGFTVIVTVMSAPVQVP